MASDKPLSPTQRAAQVICSLMSEQGITDVELATRTGLPRTTLRTYLSGNLKTLSLDKLETIAGQVGITLPDLLSQSEHMRGYIKKETSTGGFNIFNLRQYKMRIECDSPMNPYHAHGRIHFFPKADYYKKNESAVDIWIFLKSEGGIITVEYGGKSEDIKGGDKILFNGRHPFRLTYPTDDRNKRKLAQTKEADREIQCSFSSSPPFWLY